MMFIETSAKTRPVQIHVQRRHRSSSLSCESISKRFWLEPRISQGRQHRCSFNMNQHKFFGSHTDENTRFMLARRALVSAMATASWQKTSGVDGCLETEAVHVRVSSFYDFLLWTSRRALPLLTVSVQKNQVLAFLAKPPAICHPRVFPAVRRFVGGGRSRLFGIAGACGRLSGKSVERAPIFLVRHGQSTWNLAAKRLDLWTMFRQVPTTALVPQSLYQVKLSDIRAEVDHALTAEGVEQDDAPNIETCKTSCL